MTTDGSSTVTGSIFSPPRVNASSSRYHDCYSGQNVAFLSKVNSHSLILFRDYYCQVAYFVKYRQTHRGNHKCVLSQVTILCRNILAVFKLVKEKQNPELFSTINSLVCDVQSTRTSQENSYQLLISVLQSNPDMTNDITQRREDINFYVPVTRGILHE